MADQILQDIKDRLDIAEVIGGYIQLKKAGTSYKALCPFHNEKSPSMQISPQKQIWHCFGCGEGGDIFGFVMKYENIEFKDALKLLAEKAGIKLPEYKPRDKTQIDKTEQLYKINDFAARFYNEMLLKDKHAALARDYLKKRGLTTATINQWKIGYAPNDFHVLEQALTKKKVSLADLVAAGVSTKNERGQIYDRFRGRIMFPIFNSLGAVVGFSARILPELDNPNRPMAKYINSPETLIYSKSKVLFGFNFAKGAIRKADEIIVVEGQMDCISAHQAGFANVVASSGTALTPEQLTQVGRLTKNLKFCFDSDQAGLLATKRAVGNYLGKDFTIKIINFDIPGVKDPDDLIKKDPQEFARQVQRAPLFLDFYIEQSFIGFTGSVSEKKKIAKELLPLIKFLTDPVEQDHYVQLLAEKLGTTIQALREALSTEKTVDKKSEGKDSAIVAPNLSRPVLISPLEKQIIGGLIVFPQYREFVIQLAGPKDFKSSETAQMYQNIIQSGSESVNQTPLVKECVFMVESLLAESGGNELAVITELKKSFAILRLQSIKQQQKDLSSQIQQVEGRKERTVVIDLNKEFMSLNKVRLELEKFV